MDALCGTIGRYEGVKGRVGKAVYGGNYLALFSKKPGFYDCAQNSGFSGPIARYLRSFKMGESILFAPS
ncbi:protein of unknown function [Methylocaldum szegediense]|uniref:Uncharacterized protein n=1 Tax=Methylocaldum szegediense TaxID=73780 RepID=A0ABM9I1L6_9GAMM|nr:protein of unknown function [Methylocaldum szegediense]